MNITPILLKSMVLYPVWDYEAPNYQHKINYNRSKNFEDTTETIMFYTRC